MEPRMALTLGYRGRWRKVVAAAGGPLALLVVAASAAFACVSHTGLGTLDHSVANLDNPTRSGTQPQYSNYGNCVGRANVGTNPCVGLGVANIEVTDDDDILSIVNFTPTTTTPAVDRTGQFSIHMTAASGTCTSSSTKMWPGTTSSRSPAVAGPVFEAIWDVGNITTTNYTVCVAPPSGSPNTFAEEITLIGLGP